MKNILLLLVFLLQLDNISAQNFRSAAEMKNAIDLYIDLGYRIRSCKDRCDFDYCSRVFGTWYSQAPRDYYNQREDDITNAWEASKKSPIKAKDCDCSKYEKPNLNLGVKAQKQTQALNTLSSSLLDLAKSFDKAKAERKEKQQREAEAQQASISFMDRAEAEAGKGTSEGYRSAVNILLPRLNELDGDGLNTLGFYYWKQEDYTNSFKYFKLSAAKGSDIGIYDLAYAYENGHGTTIDKNIAFHYYTKISPNYSSIKNVYHQLGHLCEEGANNDSNKPDYEAAFSYFLKGANIGEVSCMFHLGDYYNTGGKLATDLQKAKYWYQKACDLKNEKACEKLKTLQ